MPVEHPSKMMTKRDYEAAKSAQASSSPKTERAVAPIEPSQVEGAGRLRKSEKFYAGLADQINKEGQETIPSDEDLVRDAIKEIDKAFEGRKGIQKADENELNAIFARLSFRGRDADQRQKLQQHIRQIWKLKDSIHRLMDSAKNAKLDQTETKDQAERAAADLEKKLRKLVA